MKIETCKKVLQKMNNCHPINKKWNVDITFSRYINHNVQTKNLQKLLDVINDFLCNLAAGLKGQS